LRSQVYLAPICSRKQTSHNEVGKQADEQKEETGTDARDEVVWSLFGLGNPSDDGYMVIENNKCA